MALPGHSPPPHFALARSPPRMMNAGHPEHHYAPPMYSHRPVVPPSPQPFPPYRPHQHNPIPHPGPVYDMKAPVVHHPLPPAHPHKRPGSSMSLSSILGAEPERPLHDISLFQHPTQPSNGLRTAHSITPGMSVNAIMSPPQQPMRGGPGDYPYKRSQTPDRLETAAGNRQRSASSSAQMAPFRPMYELQDRYAKPPTPQFFSTAPYQNPSFSRDEQEERARRTSLSAILQRPSSQPQSTIPVPQPPSRSNWYADPPPPAAEPPRSNGTSGSYDTRPPVFRDNPRSIVSPYPSSSIAQSQSMSPEVSRTSNGSFNRGFASILNGPAHHFSETTSAPSQDMMRQHSSQSQSERSVFGDRNRFRHFSPFAGSHLPPALDDLGRKASEDIAHKTIVGLGLDGKRGRYSPVPQAVQGAQAQTPIPDAGPKGDQGKVFSGIGGGVGNSTTPIPNASSPFKKDENMTRSGDGLRIGRGAHSTGKRARKIQDDESRMDVDLDGKKQTSSAKLNKKAKHQSYKTTTEEPASSVQRRGTPVAGARTVNTSSIGSSTVGPSIRYDTAPMFRPRKIVRVASIVCQTLKRPRKHLGSFKYDPDVLLPEYLGEVDMDKDIYIKPKLLPPFSEVDDLNGTFTIHVSKIWLQERERRLICSTRNLWGSGIYTDDTDPLAAAMHMGWIKPSFFNVDETLLQKIVHEQNPKIEISKELKPPTRPLDLSKGRDLKITCVVMPLLERYEDTARFGLKSRAWPEEPDGTCHDGVSFSILKVEAVDIGPEEKRMGRTGTGKRARIQAQLLQRERAKRLETERVERMIKRAKERADIPKRNVTDKRKIQAISTKAPSPLSNEVLIDAEPTADVILTTVNDGDEFLRQLASAAA